MTTKPIHLLSAVVFLNALAAGFTVPYISPHIIMNGGNDIITGTLLAGSCACQKISKNFHAHFHHGVKFSMVLSLYITLGTYLMLIFNYSFWVILPCRFLYSMTNRISTNSKEIMAASGSQTNLKQNIELLDISQILGVSFGAILGGYIFYIYQNFAILTMIASSLTLANLFIMERLEENPSIVNPGEQLNVVPSNCKKEIESIQQLKWRSNWNALLLKIAYISSFNIFFTKFVLLLKYNYHIGTVLIGYTVAYQTMLSFASKTITPIIYRQLQSIFQTYSEWILLTCSITLVSEFYAPSYECYLILFIPLIFLHTSVEAFIDELLGLQNEPAVQSIASLIEICVPFFFGFVCFFSGKHAFKIFCLLPSAVCIYMLHKRFFEQNSTQIITQSPPSPPPSTRSRFEENTNKED